MRAPRPIPARPLTEDIARLKLSEVSLWAGTSAVVLAAAVTGAWAYLSFAPPAADAGVPDPIAVEIAQFDAAPMTESLDTPEGELSSAAAAVPETTPEMVEETAELTPPPELPPEVLPEEMPEELPPEEVPPEDIPPEEVPPPEEVVEDIPDIAPEVPPEAVPPEVAPAQETAPAVDVPDPAVTLPPPPESPPDETAEDVAAPIPMPPRRPDRPRTQPRPQPPAQQASAAAAPPPAPRQAEQATTTQANVGAAPSRNQIARWDQLVGRHIERRKVVPPAVRRGARGSVSVNVRIDRSGRVLGVTVLSSSGNPELDQAAVALVQSSSPLPAPPEGMPENQLLFTLPVDYTRSR
ncbi:periplasmic protein TonB [Ketogulonicigenium robustum]|uniref:Periplasmic protein TonB n=1 Tax=Ketogulonicigenium robustum TaxID=92947 RepID=A0A1W6P1Q5_9RHOB|nr:energy transducer TonB [Ketogulonicigenium robustum]ARO15353.1 periplasmic protein TonB [Ketogulonicigenium robustum]